MIATRPPAPITNRSALVGWVFMAIWLAMLLIFTRLFIREGGFHQFGYGIEVAIMGVFWLAGVAGAAQAFTHPVIRIERSGDAVTVTERWPLSAQRHILPAGSGLQARIAVERDSDGDTYYACRLTLPGGREIYVFQSPVRTEADEALARLARLAA